MEVLLGFVQTKNAKQKELNFSPPSQINKKKNITYQGKGKA